MAFARGFKTALREHGGDDPAGVGAATLRRGIGDRVGRPTSMRG